MKSRALLVVVAVLLGSLVAAFARIQALKRQVSEARMQREQVAVPPRHSRMTAVATLPVAEANAEARSPVPVQTSRTGPRGLARETARRRQRRSMLKERRWFRRS